MKQLKTIVLCALALWGCSSGTKYVVRGTAPADCEGKYVYMLRHGNFLYGEPNTNCDSALVENGQFRFSGCIDGDSIRFLSTGRNVITLIVEPGEIVCDFNGETSLGGTPLNEALSEYDHASDRMRNTFNGEYMSLLRDTTAESEQRKDELSKNFQREYREFVFPLIAQNKQNSFGEYVLKEYLDVCRKIEDFDAAYDLLERRPVNYGPLKGSIMRWEERGKTSPGKMFTDFTVPNGNIDGTSVSLSDYVGKGKFVLVDFWASWCGWCRREFPVLKEVYAKHKGDRFELLGIAVNDKREATLKAMEEDGVCWPQIINTGKKAMQLYGITGIPEIILFAPDGTILERGLRGEHLKAKVDEVLAN